MSMLTPLRVFLLLSLALGTYATLCTRPMSPEHCSISLVVCPDAKKARCESEGGVFMKLRGLCGYCDLCAQNVGLGASCNTTITEGGYTTAICQPPLLCTGNNGTCVEECTEYTN